MLISLTRPTLRRKDYNSVLNCLVTDQIAPGPLNHEFSAALSKAIGVSGAVALISYRSSIHCAFELLELQEGDGVLISALAPRVYRQVIESRGLVAAVTDVDAERPLLSIDSVKQKLGAGVKAIVLHYTLGSLPAGEELFELGVPVIEDITQVVGAGWGDQPCGSRGRVAVLSLDPGGLLTTGCGGALLCRDRRSVRILKEITSTGYSEELLPDMNAALGISQVRELPRFLQRRAEIGQIFREALMRSRHTPLLAEGECVDFGFPILVKDSRPEIRRYAEKRGVETEAAFKDAVVAVEGSTFTVASAFPNAEQLLWRCLLFPLYPSLARKDVQLLGRVLSTLP
ncbi:MAG: DegT/DnrJ/EryC1/StrS aminotransferase family protein [Spirochaetaceae bacterium]|nr:MAG: DegT/DnrJ/EryC1/StrS aminotransferase family protein [Spirochaetaceae bacterium]